jgi:hypothetical protein
MMFILQALAPLAPSFWTLKKWSQIRVPKSFFKVFCHVDPDQQELTRGQDHRGPQILEVFKGPLSKNHKKALGILEQKS